MNPAVELIKRRRRLAEHVALVVAKPCEWGQDDCTAWAAAWVEKERGVSVALPIYQTREDAHALISSAGGLVNLWSKTMADAGVPETDEPQYGDVGVMDTRKFGPVGFIMSDFGVALWRADSGYLGIRPGSILKAWSV